MGGGGGGGEVKRTQLIFFFFFTICCKFLSAGSYIRKQSANSTESARIEHSVYIAIITVCVCFFILFFALLLLFVTLYIFLHLSMYSCTFGREWMSRDCLYCIGMGVLW